ncbi:MAG: hypothetical protein ABSF60_14110 [Verrucomicrobiota bacterium]
MFPPSRAAEWNFTDPSMLNQLSTLPQLPFSLEPMFLIFALFLSPG